jgi:16S rRNA (cytidine1402-2'-O)-methyltransferase
MSLSKGLYVVATPIGNPDDITLRAIKVLKEVDFVICEERKIGSRLLRSLDIKKEIIELNEHNERKTSHELV